MCGLIKYFCFMQSAKKLLLHFLKLLLFFILLFDLQRILFSTHNWVKFQDNLCVDWLLSFIYPNRIDFPIGSFIRILMLLFITTYFKPSKITRSLIHAREINTYTEWRSFFTRELSRL